MSLVADYSSSGDELKTSSSPLAQVVNVSDSEKSSVKNMKRKKRKVGKRKLKSTLFLPPEIQEALARGGDSESEDEGDGRINISRKDGNPKDLLSLLPPARTSRGSSLLAQTSKSLSISKSSISHDKLNSSPSGLRINEGNVSHTVSLNEEESPSEDDDLDLVSKMRKEIDARSLLQTPLLTLASHKQKEPSKSSEPIAFNSAPPTLSSMMYHKGGIEMQPNIIEQNHASNLPVHGEQHQVSYYHQHQQVKYDANQSNEFDVEAYQSSSKPTRRRVRDAERKLASGLLQDGLADIPVSVVDYQARDPSAYNQFAEGGASTIGNLPEVEVRGQRYNPSTGETEIVKGASKGQKRKHQINSLAVQAASRELEIMDKRGAGFLTKAQTQAKYGW